MAVKPTHALAIYKSENWSEKLAQSSILGWNVLAGYATLSPHRVGLYAAVFDARSHRLAPGLGRWGPRGASEANTVGVSATAPNSAALHGCRANRSHSSTYRAHSRGLL